MRAVEIRALNYLRHRKEFRAWHNEIRDEYWDSVVTRRLWQYICLRYKEGGPKLKRISIQRMEEWVEAHSFKHKDRYADVFCKMRRMKYDPKDKAVLTFLRRTGFKHALEDGISLLDDPEGLGRLSVVRDRIDSLVKLSERSSTQPVSYFDAASKRTEAIRRGVIPSGLSEQFDKLCAGGIGIGELHIFLGATNTGKTALLCNTSAGALKSGKNVLYFTLDDCSGSAIARRIDQILLGVPEETITRNPKTFVRKLQHLRTKGYGDLYIVDYNDRDTTLMNIRAAVENMLEEGLKLDVLAIDYIDVMIPSEGPKMGQQAFLQVCRGLKRLGREFDLRIWTAGQGNRESLDADLIKLSHMAGEIAKAKSAEVVYGINQTEVQRAEDTMLLTCLRSRVFRKWDDKVWIGADWDTMRLEGLHG